MFRAILFRGARCARPANEFFRIEFFRGSHRALFLTTKIRFLTFVTQVVGEPVHGILFRLSIKGSAYCRNVVISIKAHVAQTQCGFSFHLFIQVPNRICKWFQHCVLNLLLTNWTMGKPKCNSGPRPSPFQNGFYAMEMENMSTVQLNRRGLRQTFRVTHQTKIIVVLGALGGAWLGVTSVQTRQTLFLVAHAVAHMTARVNFRAGLLCACCAGGSVTHGPHHAQNGRGVTA